MRTVKENAETNENLRETIRNLQQANQGLKKENETHLGFIQEAIQPTQHENNEKQKVQEIKELKQRIEEMMKINQAEQSMRDENKDVNVENVIDKKQEKKIITQKNNEINDLKTGIRILEETLKDKKYQTKECEERMKIMKVDLEREKTINTVLINNQLKKIEENIGLEEEKRKRGNERLVNEQKIYSISDNEEDKYDNNLQTKDDKLEVCDSGYNWNERHLETKMCAVEMGECSLIKRNHGTNEYDRREESGLFNNIRIDDIEQDMEDEDCKAIHDSTGEWINVDVYDTLEDSCMSTSQGDRRTFGQSVKDTSREYESAARRNRQSCENVSSLVELNKEDEEQKRMIRRMRLEAQREVCEHEFNNGHGSCKQSGCEKRHKLNFERIQNCLCFREFEKMGSCKRKNNCWFTHEIPDKIRREKEAIEKIKILRSNIKRNKEERKKKRSNNGEQNGSNKNERKEPIGNGEHEMESSWGKKEKRIVEIIDMRNKERVVEICEKEFKNGKGACKSRECSKKHNIDFVKLNNGICRKELWEKGSCKKNKCKYTHEIPSQMRRDLGITTRKREKATEETGSVLMEKYEVKDGVEENSKEHDRMIEYKHAMGSVQEKEENRVQIHEEDSFLVLI